MGIQRINYRGSQRPAHNRVSITRATTLFKDTNVDWPVSGDQTTWEYGKRGTKLLSQKNNIWYIVSR